jgi:hypothetical protein
MEQTKLDGGEANKKIILGIVIAGVLIVAGALLYLNGGSTGGVLQKGSAAGDCLVLAQEYCDTVRMVTVDAQGTKAAAFSLPVGTPVYMPFDGVYTDETGGGTAPSQILSLSTLDGASLIRMVAMHTPSVASGSTVKKGDQFAVVAEGGAEGKAFNFVVYADNYDLTNLFKAEPTPVAQ